MTRPLVLALGTLSLASGCASSEIWLLQIDAADAQACGAPIITHTFLGAQALDTSSNGDWTPGTRSESTDELRYAQLTTTTRGAGVLLVGDQAYEGTRDGDEWTFSWSEGDGQASWQDHYSGYGYAEYYETNETVEIVMTIDGNTAKGSWRSDVTSTTTWKESDTWNDDAANEIGWTGSIPSAQYLGLATDGGSLEEVFNDGELIDCDNAEDPGICAIASTVECSDNRKFDGTRTDYRDEDAYAHLADAGN